MEEESETAGHTRLETQEGTNPPFLATGHDDDDDDDDDDDNDESIRGRPSVGSPASRRLCHPTRHLRDDAFG